MKKIMWLLALAMGFNLSASADVSPSTSKDIYDISNYGQSLLDLFYNALQQGRKYPTPAEFEAAGFNLMDMAFVRSHERLREIDLNHAKDVNPSVKEGRKLWMNIPIGLGKIQGGYPNCNTADDPFTGWNYTALFGCWNHGIFHAPGCVVDAGHRNGTDVLGGVKFFEGWTQGSQAGGWVTYLTTKDKNGYAGFKYVEPLINALMFFGQDGINYNWEDTGYDNTDVVSFHQACYKLAHSRGFKNFRIGLYTSNSTLTSGNVKALYGQNNQQTATTFLNYSGGDFQTAFAIQSSVGVAESAMGSCSDVYQGALLSGLERRWDALVQNETNKKMNIVLWGEHHSSRVHSWTKGDGPVDMQEQYQRRQEYLYSGGNRNVAKLPALCKDVPWADEADLKRFHGIAYMVPERTALVQNLPFTTYFNTGIGTQYNYKGKKTAGPWYNMGNQDILPTYRWLVYNKGTQTAATSGIPELTNVDAYMGGACMRLTALLNRDYVLYRCKLTVTGANPRVTVALKNTGSSAKGSLSVIVKKQGSDEWFETPLTVPVYGTPWNEQTVPLEGIAQGDVIENVGLRSTSIVKGILVGELSLNDDSQATPAGIKEAVVEVKEETQKSLSVKVRWDVDASAVSRADYGLLYNDEANVDHFEVLYKNGAEGRVSEIGRTVSWGTYIGNLPMSADEKPFVGVRAASVDGKTYSDVYWVEVPRADAADLPADNQFCDEYPAIYQDMNGESIQTDGYVSKFQVTGSDADFTYTNTTGSPYMRDEAAGVPKADRDQSGYIIADNVIKCHQGQTLTCTMNVTGGDLQADVARCYCDWDGNKNFEVNGDEVVWKVGTSNSKKWEVRLTNGTVTFKVKVPADAVPGKSRLRVVFAQNYYPHPGPSGAAPAGLGFDIPMEITGTGDARTPYQPHDLGVSDDPLDQTTGIKTVSKDGVSKARFENGEIRLDNCDKVWVVSSEGKLMKYAHGDVKSLNTTGYAPGVYLVRMMNGQVMRTAKVIVK